MKRKFKIWDRVKLSKPYQGKFEYGYIKEYKSGAHICKVRVHNQGDIISVPVEELTYMPCYVITEDFLKKLIRYEYTYADYISYVVPAGNWKCNTCYEYTLDDMAAAVNNIREKNPDVKVLSDWAELVNDELESNYDIDGNAEYDEDNKFMGYSYPMNDSAMADSIYMALVDYSGYDEYKYDTIPVNLPQVAEDIVNYRQHRPMQEYKWSLGKKLDTLYLADSSNVQRLSDKEKSVMREVLLELSAKDIAEAIRILGYCYYGGNALFSCDWEKSRDCFVKLMNMESVSELEKCQYANTLGYIYYYGRCTGGVPEYDKAFNCFTLGAAGGIYESMYKLADMYTHGYYVHKNARAAATLITMVYNENYTLIKHQVYDCQFADAALRMGNLCRDGIAFGDEYYYYTLADYAIKKRFKYDNYGDNKVFAGIQKELARIRESHPLKSGTSITLNSVPTVLINMFDKFSCHVHVKLLKDNLSIKVTRLPQPGQQTAELVFDCYPEYGLCRLTDSVTVTAQHVIDPLLEKGEKVSFVADDLIWHRENDLLSCTFTHHDEEVFSFTASKIKYRLPVNTKKDQTEYVFASVIFSPGGNQYDYICDLPDVNAGDRVVVNANGTEKEVTVVRVYRMAIDDMPLDNARYKTILRKIYENE